jgi:hypothetical protein
MVWKNYIITVDKENKAITALLQTLLIVGIFFAIWKLTPLVGLLELGSRTRGEALRANIAICLTPLFLLPFLMIFKSYKIDLYNYELTTSSDILFWEKRKKEKLNGNRTYTILVSKNSLHSNELIVQLNNKKITVSKELHSSEIAELSNYLEQHGFEKSS